MARGDLALVDRHSTPVSVEVQGISIRAATEKTGVLEVILSEGKLRVLAHKGTAVVTAGDQVFEVKEGTMLESSLDSAPQGAAGAGASTLRAVILPLAIGGGIAALGLALLLTAETCRTVSPAGLICTP